jgi:hypothetical protein
MARGHFADPLTPWVSELVNESPRNTHGAHKAFACSKHTCTRTPALTLRSVPSSLGNDNVDVTTLRKHI